ncbi:hypothetical protein V8F06_014085 [Rhypophila decipiens]
MSDTIQTPGDSMYCHGCHHQWQRQGEDIECPACRSASTEIITSDDDPRRFHGRQSQQTESTSTAQGTTPVFYGPERPPSTTPPQSNSRPASRNASRQGNTNAHRPAAAPQQFIFAPMTFHFTIISDRAPPQPQPQPEQASATEQQQAHGPPPMGWFGIPFFTPSFQAPPPAPASTTTNSPPTGSAEGPAPSSQDQAQSQAQTPAENGEQQQQQEGQTPPQRPAGPRMAPGVPGGFMTLLLASLFDQSGMMFGNPDAVYSQEAFDRIITQLREANANGGGAPPASQSALDKLQTKEVDDEMLSASEDKPKCVICVDEMVKGEKASVLPCSHLFHGECVTMWLKQHNTCPVCRRSIEEEVQPKTAKTMDHEFHTHDAHQHEQQENAHNTTTGCM